MKADKQDIFIKLKSWGETILFFMLESKDEAYMTEAADWLESLNKCINLGKLSLMKTLIGDLNEMVMGMDQTHIIALNRILREKFGEDLSSRMARSMAAVLRRGKIRNDDEFVRVNEWIDHLLYDRDNPDAEQQIEQYNRMLRDYEEKAARRIK